MRRCLSMLERLFLLILFSSFLPAHAQSISSLETIGNASLSSSSSTAYPSDSTSPPSNVLPPTAFSSQPPSMPPAPVLRSAPVVNAGTQAAAGFNYSNNLRSNVFGAKLFSGAFAQQGSTRFNPDYVISAGDQVEVRLWGAYQLDSIFVVDPEGNIFLPHLGPLKLLGVRNQDLQTIVDSAVRQVFRSNVFSYASLAAAQPVRVYVGGFVNRPGLYDGTSMDSLLHYVDEAGGIDPARGSFLDVQVKRGGQVRADVNLYDFLLDGRMPLVQFADGDVIFVPPRKNIVTVSGLAENANIFEFSSDNCTLADIDRLAKPRPETTNVRITRNKGSVRNVEYYSLDQAGSVLVGNGDELEFTADKQPGTITVRVEGEQLGQQEYVLPYGTRMGALLKQIRFSDRSDTASIQLFRESVRERQEQMLRTSLENLAKVALTARSATNDEAALRKDEANLILQWVDRAKTVHPTGQVLIAQSRDRDDLLLENGDILNIPVKDGLILVSGEVMFPNTIAYDPELDVDDYIHRAGGYTQNSRNARVIVAHIDGSYENANEATIRAGDEILVLPKIDFKSLQITKDISQILYQLAISARVVVGL